MLDISALESVVLSKCDSFVSMGIWPAGDKITPRKWLSNFKADDVEFALYLLNTFTYYSLDVALALLRSSIIGISANIAGTVSIRELQDSWKEFLSDTVFVPVVGEERSVTDSGNILAGHLRRDLLVPEQNIFTVDQLYDTRFASVLRGFKNLIFIDDFVGSGNQFTEMWTNPYERDSALLPSVGEQCDDLALQVSYCPLIVTTKGKEKVNCLAPAVKLYWAHLLDETFSLLHPENKMWPAHLKANVPDFIRRSSNKAGIPSGRIEGFHHLCLNIAFSFTIPDATLPLFWWNENGWHPLMART